ncbi:hypothetical protein BDN72DRAFT_82215 [Pluteus cervinus]|uniref:Uncharacterized protein n=1 Tax=Pluteus cervinus TaxID=181527 RepID=A0ACD3B7Q0_9AGAR|nr:hypothetical protein BDN72DRAFT_82215 [Pluteus cervinus]
MPSRRTIGTTKGFLCLLIPYTRGDLLRRLYAAHRTGMLGPTDLLGLDYEKLSERTTRAKPTGGLPAMAPNESSYPPSWLVSTPCFFTITGQQGGDKRTPPIVLVFDHDFDLISTSTSVNTNT